MYLDQHLSSAPLIESAGFCLIPTCIEPHRNGVISSTTCRGVFVLLRQITTTAPATLDAGWLYLIFFLHQTTTHGYRTGRRSRLYLITFLHQTTTSGAQCVVFCVVTRMYGRCDTLRGTLKKSVRCDFSLRKHKELPLLWPSAPVG